MSKLSPDVQAEIQEEAKDWDTEVKRLKALLPEELSRDTLKNKEIPDLENRLKELETSASKALASKNLVSGILYKSDPRSMFFRHKKVWKRFGKK